MFNRSDYVGENAPGSRIYVDLGLTPYGITTIKTYFM